MLDGVMLAWFLLTALSLVFVAVDIRSTPESPVLKWGFVLLTAYTGVIGATLYFFGCREPRPGLHERFTAARWRQTLGSTMHCVAGDGVGILAGAVISRAIGLGGPLEVALEYALGFAFGWTIFQSLFMRQSAGGSYRRALASTFVPELLSMNVLMAGMVPTVMALRTRIGGAEDPATPQFWFVMSMGLLAGFVIAYPINWWLVANHLKHGMMTVQPAPELKADQAAPPAMAGMDMGQGNPAQPAMDQAGTDQAGTDHAAMAHSAMAPKAPAPVGMAGMEMGGGKATRPPLPVMTLISFAALAAGLAIAFSG